MALGIMVLKLVTTDAVMETTSVGNHVAMGVMLVLIDVLI